jgi:alkylation response protein AidB-like acyl-CoA dehydrogenase
MLAMTVVLEELARWDGAFALLVEAHNGLSLAHLNKVGSDAQKKKYLPDLAAGKKIGSWCLSEPHCGTDAAALTCRAEKRSAGWVLNGQNTLGDERNGAGVYSSWRSPAERGSATISAFNVEPARKAWNPASRQTRWAMRGSDTCR